MASLNMGSTSYKLIRDEVNRVVTRTQAGNYALGYQKEDTFIVKYVGRADSDVADRLLKHADKAKYARFKFSYASSEKAAYEKECQNYHDFGEKESLDNKIHPDLPDNSKKWKCPVCDVEN